MAVSAPLLRLIFVHTASIFSNDLPAHPAKVVVLGRPVCEAAKRSSE